MSIAESSSEAHTLIEPVITPVKVFSAMRKAAAPTERRAAEALSFASETAAPAACVPTSCIFASGQIVANLMWERVRMLGDLIEASAPPQRDHADAREDEQRRDRVAQPRLLARAEQQRGDDEGEERLEVDVDGDRARRDPLQRPGVEVVGADRLHEHGVDEHEPDQEADRGEVRPREVVAAEGDRGQ